MPENETTTLQDLNEALQELYQQYDNSYTTPEAVNALLKTLKSFNITINDWNTVINHLNGTLGDIDKVVHFINVLYSYLSDADLAGQEYVQNYVKSNVVKNQVVVTFIKDILTNINDRTFIHYTTQNVTVNSYPAIKILRDGNTCTEQDAKEYMEYMTGSHYLPKYNYDKPANTYFIKPDGSVYKPQYDSTNGLLLYSLGNLASKDYVDTAIAGTENYQNADSIVYSYGKIYSVIKIKLTEPAVNTDITCMLYVMANRKTTLQMLDNGFDLVRQQGITIPTIESSETFTDALRIVQPIYNDGLYALAYLINTLLQGSLISFKKVLTIGAREYDLFKGGDTLYYLDTSDSQFAPLMMLLNGQNSGVATATDVQGWVND